MYNSMRTVLLLGGLTALLIFIGGAAGGQSGMLIALILAGVMNIGSYWFSDKIVLGMYRAQPIEEAQAPELHAVVKGLAQRAGLPMPRVAVIPQESPNAFATGRDPDHAVVAVTEGLLRLMDREELTGVLAHEMGHVKNRDILIGLGGRDPGRGRSWSWPTWPASPPSSGSADGTTTTAGASSACS